MRCPSGLAVSASRGIRPPAEASMAAVRVGRVGPHRKREAGRDWRPRPSAGCTRGSCRPKVSHRSSARGPGEGLTSEPSEGKAPLLDALRERGRRGHEVSMHFPGHKVWARLPLTRGLVLTGFGCAGWASCWSCVAWGDGRLLFDTRPCVLNRAERSGCPPSAAGHPWHQRASPRSHRAAGAGLPGLPGWADPGGDPASCINRFLLGP